MTSTGVPVKTGARLSVTWEINKPKKHLGVDTISFEDEARLANQRNQRRQSTWSASAQFFHENWHNIVWDLMILILTFSEIAMVLYLSIQHFLHAYEVLEGMAMFLPIALNFIGVMYFLSNAEERVQFEKIGCSRCCTDILQFPVFGPVLTQFMVVLISTGWTPDITMNYLRLEASAGKMRQATTFFSAAPEAVVQMTLLLINKTEYLSFEKYIEMAIVIVALLAIAEANTFSLKSNYFRLFHKFEEGDWHLPHALKFWQKTLLFLHAFSSVGSRLVAEAFVIAGLYYYFQDTVAFVIFIVGSTLIQAGYNTLVYYGARLVKHLWLGVGVPSGCYESINYGWRQSILSFGFQSKNVLAQLWFYVENTACFLFWIRATLRSSDSDAHGWVYETTFWPMSVVFCSLITTSIITLVIIHSTKLFLIRGPFYKKLDVPSHNGQAINC